MKDRKQQRKSYFNIFHEVCCNLITCNKTYQWHFLHFRGVMGIGVAHIHSGLTYLASPVYKEDMVYICTQHI